MLTGDMHKTDPVCDKSPDHHLIQTAIAKAGQSQKTLVYRDPKNAIPISIAETE
jgi:pyrroloquinoline quinone biosynthesis protein E